MPIYEFRCTECDEVSEEMLSFKNKKKTIECPICGSRSEKILSLGSFHLKGSGWYKDCLLYTSPSPRDLSTSRMPSSA